MAQTPGEEKWDGEASRHPTAPEAEGPPLHPLITAIGRSRATFFAIPAW